MVVLVRRTFMSTTAAATLIAVAVIATLSAGPFAQGAAPPRGLVGSKGAAFVDGRGAWLPLGATLFWAPWGFKFDRERLERELDLLSKGGVDYIRVLGEVGDPASPDDSWADRTIDPRWSDTCGDNVRAGCGSYDEVVAGLTDLAFDTYGLRVEWTVFGATSSTPTPESRRALVDRLLKMSKGREHKIMHFEIANEFFQNGFGGSSGLQELRALGRYMQQRTSVLVALSAPSSPECSTLERLYADGVGELVTVHFGRATDGPRGMWSPVRAPWKLRECRRLPALRSSNEPIGPFSSVEDERDPLRLAMAAAVTYISGVGSYVLHTGAGVRGGGRADLERGRPANVGDVPNIQTILQGLENVRRRLPAEIPNWTRFHATATNPFITIERASVEAAYGAQQGNRFVVAAIGVKDKLTFRARSRLTIEVLDPLSGGTLWSGVLKAGQVASVAGQPACLVVGTVAPEPDARPNL